MDSSSDQVKSSEQERISGLEMLSGAESPVPSENPEHPTAHQVQEAPDPYLLDPNR